MYSDQYWMAQALQLAERAKEQGEVPIGAVLVNADHQCVGSGFNQVITLHDPTAHAELLALRQAGQALQNYRLDGTTLYCTLEPCSMCAGALVHARVQRIVFAARDFKAGAAGSVCNLLKGAPFNHHVQIDEGVLQHECAALLRDFFSKRR